MPEPVSILDIAEAGKAKRRGRPKKTAEPITPATAALEAQERDRAPYEEVGRSLYEDQAARVDGDNDERTETATNDAWEDTHPPLGQVEMEDQGEEAEQLDLSDLIAADVFADLWVRPVSLTAIDAEPNPAPDAALARSVKKQGIRVPVLLATSAPGRYAVVDGARRVAAARKAGLLDVPSLHIPLQITDPRTQALRVALNRIRSDNVPAEARSVWEMLRDGAEETAIQDATELPLSVVRKRAETWGKLLPALRDEFALGRVQPNVAEKAATLPHDTQAKLLEILKREGRLTMKDVKHFIDGEEVREQVSFLASKDPGKKATKALEEGAALARAAGWERAEWMQAAQDAYSEASETVPLGGGGGEG